MGRNQDYRQVVASGRLYSLSYCGNDFHITVKENNRGGIFEYRFISEKRANEFMDEREKEAAQEAREKEDSDRRRQDFDDQMIREGKDPAEVRASIGRICMDYCTDDREFVFISDSTIYSRFRNNGYRIEDLETPLCSQCATSNSYGEYGCPRLNKNLPIREAYCILPIGDGSILIRKCNVV